MRLFRALVVASALVLPLLASAPAAQAAELVGRTATLATPTHRLLGAPAAGTVADQQLKDVWVDLDLKEGTLYVEANLLAVPDEDFFHRPNLRVVPGTWNGSRCLETAGGARFGDGFDSTGKALEFSHSLPAGWDTATCAHAFVTTPDDSAAYDAVGGPLDDRLVSPVLGVAKPKLLGSRKIGLVRGVWTPVDVEISNSGEGTAHSVAVTGKGRGVKVKKATLTDLSWFGSADKPGTRTAQVMVKLTRPAKKAKLTLTAASEGVTARRSVVVRRIAAPRAPRPGRYAGGGASFFVTGGKSPKVKGFRMSTQTECSSSTYDTNNTYGFPTTAISRAGIVSATDSRSGETGYTVGVEMLVAGSKATRGSFFYSGPAGCFARASFTAKRVGR